MIRRMTDKLGHLAHGHQKTLQHQQPVPGLPLPVTTHTHLEHRGSISTQCTSESSKRGESVDDTRPIDESNFPCQRRARAPTDSPTSFFNAHSAQAASGESILVSPLSGRRSHTHCRQSGANIISGSMPSKCFKRKRSSSPSRSITRTTSSKCCSLCRIRS